MYSLSEFFSQEINALFRCIDKDHSGVVTTDELKEWVDAIIGQGDVFVSSLPTSPTKTIGSSLFNTPMDSTTSMLYSDTEYVLPSLVWCLNSSQQYDVMTTCCDYLALLCH